MHSTSWSFMIMLPIAYYQSFDVGPKFLELFILNTVIHAVTDHLKANLKIINLWRDQGIHIIQIVVTFILLM